jgi:predicted house-cleaning noncanonical NTP pyrophosphatase (MazG superfamily)
MRTTYGKLIRDLIPPIMERAGVRYATRSLAPDAYRLKLAEKLQEEASEVARAATRAERVAELADLHEVLLALQASEGITADEVEAVRIHRLRERGGFEQRLELLWTEAADEGG